MKVYFDGLKRIVVERSEESKRCSIFPRYLLLPKEAFPKSANFRAVRVSYQLEFLLDGRSHQFQRYVNEAIWLKHDREREDILRFPLGEAIQREISNLMYGYHANEESQSRAREIVKAKRLRLKITNVICELVDLKEIRTDFPILLAGKIKLSA